LEALSTPGPAIVDIRVDEMQNVLPIVPPGAANRDMIPDLSMGRVSGSPEQTVARRGSSVFRVSESSGAERERLEPLERKERVCVEIPTPAPILMKNLG